MTLLEQRNLECDKWGLNSCGCQQVATVLFDRREDQKDSKITIITGNGIVNQKVGHNKYNPSSRRRSVCTYVFPECAGESILKICTIQHKGQTLLEVHDVSAEEIDYLFRGIDLEIYV